MVPGCAAVPLVDVSGTKTATCTAPGLPRGSYEGLAAYNGNSNFQFHDVISAFVVDQADTTTEVSVSPSAVTAHVAPVAPERPPDGQVTFKVDGSPVGTANLDGTGTAILALGVRDRRRPHSHRGLRRRQRLRGVHGHRQPQGPDPHLGGHQRWAQERRWLVPHPRQRLLHLRDQRRAAHRPCPAAVRLGEGASQSVTKTITATDGGADTASETGINIDITPPTVSIGGISKKAPYFVRGPKAECVATDALSGIGSCVVTRGKPTDTQTYTAVATDKAGNTATTSITGADRSLRRQERRVQRRRLRRHLGKEPPAAGGLGQRPS